MKHILKTIVLILLMQKALYGSEPVPPDDDDPFCTRKHHVGPIIEAIEQLQTTPGTTELFAAGARITSVSTRELHKKSLQCLRFNFRFFRHPSEREGYGVFTIVQIERTENTAAGTVSWRKSVSPELVLETTGNTADYCFATNLTTLHAVQEVLSDQIVRQTVDGVLPYYSLHAILLPASNPAYPDVPIPVTLEFVNQSHNGNNLTMIVEYLPDTPHFPITQKHSG